MILITLDSGSTHLVPTVASGEPDLEAYTSSLNTRTALQSAYDAGNFEPYLEPEAEALPPPPNWADFRITLMVNTTFRNWATTLPADWREDLKATAILCNADALQSTYTHLAMTYPPTAAAAAEWQAIANSTHIPVNFQG